MEIVSPSWSLPRSEHLKLSKFHATTIPSTDKSHFLYRAGHLMSFIDGVLTRNAFWYLPDWESFFPHSPQRYKCFDTTCKCIHFVGDIYKARLVCYDKVLTPINVRVTLVRTIEIISERSGWQMTDDQSDSDLMMTCWVSVSEAILIFTQRKTKKARIPIYCNCCKARTVNTHNSASYTEDKCFHKCIFHKMVVMNSSPFWRFANTFFSLLT